MRSCESRLVARAGDTTRAGDTRSLFQITCRTGLATDVGNRRGDKALVLGEAEHPMMESSRDVMREQRAEVVVPHLIEVLDNLDDDLDRIELWTAALSCFQQPAPEYQPDNVMSDEPERTTRSVLNQAEDQTVDVADQVAAEGSYGQARDSSSQVADAAGRSMKVASNTASSLGDVVNNIIETEPYTAVAIALGLGWLLGRMHRPL